MYLNRTRWPKATCGCKREISGIFFSFYSYFSPVACHYYAVDLLHPKRDNGNRFELWCGVVVRFSREKRREKERKWRIYLFSWVCTVYFFGPYLLIFSSFVSGHTVKNCVFVVMAVLLARTERTKEPTQSRTTIPRTFDILSFHCTVFRFLPFHAVYTVQCALCMVEWIAIEKNIL